MKTSWFKTMAAAAVAALTFGFAPSAEAETVEYLYPVYKTEGTPESGIREWRQGTVNATAYTGQAQIGGYGQTSWYVVRGTVFANSRITLLGDVNLILADGAVLTANQGITASVAVDPYKSFSVYAQSDDEGTMGRLVATSSNGNAAIGGCYSGMANGFGGFITINGGNVEAIVMGQSGAAAIGGAPNGNGCDGYKITINGGKVTANAAFNNQPTGGAAIGGAGFVGRGMCTTGPSVNDFIVINGGTVIASAGMGAAAIGGGGGSGSVAGLAQDIYINGGRVKAQATCGSGTAYDDAIGNGRCSNNASALAQRIMIAASLNVVAAGARISHADGQDISSILAHRGLVEVNWDDSQTEQSAAGGGTAQPSEPREPFKGIIAIPGMVEAENYDKGSEGFGYHDTDDENEGGEYRNDGVDIVKCGAGYAVGYTSEGEWLEYTVKVDEPGTYNIDAYMANGNENSEIDLLLDGEFLTHITVEGADDWDTYALGSSKAYLTAGEHTLRVTFTGDYANLDYLSFAKDVSAPGGEDPEVPPKAETVEYREPVYVGGVVTNGIDHWETNKVSQYTEVTDSMTTWGAAGQTNWYVVANDVTITDRITCQGQVNLILKDGFTLDAQAGITASPDTPGVSYLGFTVYAQTEGESMGVLTATTAGERAWAYAPIGGWTNEDWDGFSGSNITINGGIVTATSGYDFSGCAGIGGGESGAGSNITINGGIVTATSGYDLSGGAGIGGGNASAGSHITINGGTVMAKSVSHGAGIGGGGDTGAGEYITINGGEVTATGENGAGIGGGDAGAGSNITISGGTVTATGNNSAGIGGGNASAGSNITINGGTVTANSGSFGAGIGGGQEGDGECITITGGKVTATGSGAGIGGGAYVGRRAGAGSHITITGGEVEANGGNADCDAIGGGGEGAASSDIYVADTLKVLADTQKPPKRLVPHTSTTDLSKVARFKRQYALIKPMVAPLDITLSAGEGGIAAAPTQAEADDIVPVTATPNEGYEASVSVAGTSGAEVPVTPVPPNEYEFTMPAEAVEVTVVFNPMGIQVGDNVWAIVTGSTCSLLGTGATWDFRQCTNELTGVTSVTIGDGITHVGSRFFKKAYRLQSVSGGKDLASVGTNAFYLCTRLETITLDRTTAPEGMAGAVVTRTIIGPSGEAKSIPAVTPGYEQVLFGKKTLAGEDYWTELGSSAGKSIYDQGDYKFFKVDQVPVEK